MPAPLGSTAIAGTTTPSLNTPTSLGAPGTYGASARAAVASPPLTSGVSVPDGRAGQSADTPFATALAAKNADATGTTAGGTPATWTPAGCIVPARIADAPNATPATNWTAGQYIVTQRDGEVSWNGTAWTKGRHA
jgi:hypothetical protein